MGNSTLLTAVPRGSEASALALAADFATAARRYWLGVFPCLRKELRCWRARAEKIPDPKLRQLALDAQSTKVGSVEGAAAFAVFAPTQSRAAVLRALTAFQTAFDYLDLLAEQPTPDPISNGRRLHEALPVAVNPEAEHVDYYAHNPSHADAGYAQALVETCRTALASLPSHTLTLEPLSEASLRIVAYQSYNHGDARGSHHAFEQWARKESQAHYCKHGDVDLTWWERAAAAGSSMPVFALVLAAANPALEPGEIDEIKRLYYPKVAALNSLLDSLVDQHEDLALDQNRLLRFYDSPAEAIGRLMMLIARAMHEAQQLPRMGGHALILAALIGFYLDPSSAPGSYAGQSSLLDAVGDLAAPVMLVFRVRSTISRAKHKLSER